MPRSFPCCQALPLVKLDSGAGAGRRACPRHQGHRRPGQGHDPSSRALHALLWCCIGGRGQHGNSCLRPLLVPSPLLRRNFGTRKGTTSQPCGRAKREPMGPWEAACYGFASVALFLEEADGLSWSARRRVGRAAILRQPCGCESRTLLCRIAFPQKRSDTLSGPERATIAMLIDQVFCHTPDVGIENPSCSEGSSPLSDRPQRQRGGPKRSYHPCGARYISAAWKRH